MSHFFECMGIWKFSLVNIPQGHGKRFADTGVSVEKRIMNSKAVFTDTNPELAELPCIVSVFEFLFRVVNVLKQVSKHFLPIQ